MTLRRLAPALACFAVVLALSAPARAEPGDELTVSVLTFGPGDHPFFKFGHNAILVRDSLRRTERVYNFGTFGFDSPWLILDFLKGKLRYWLSVQSMRGTIAAYKAENRTIDAQELDLTPAQRKQIADALDENARPENRYYKYDYYRDNCSTRVRDAVDRVTNGAVKEASKAPARMTFRQHTLRLTADDLPVFLGLDVAMGDYIDKPITVWEEMFLPSRLNDTLAQTKIPDGNGGEKPLVKATTRVLDAQRAPLRSAPPSWAPWFFGVGALLGGGLLALGSKSRTSGRARLALAASLGVAGLVLGVLGLIFLMFWTVTDHEVAWHNENLLQCVPFAVGFVGLAAGLARGDRRSIERGYLLAAAAVGASALGLVFKVLPPFDQRNAEFIALLLPFWAGAFGAMRLLRGKSPAPASSDAARAS